MLPAPEKTPAAAPPSAGLYPVLPLRDIVVFPGMIVPLFVGRKKSIQALEEVANGQGANGQGANGQGRIILAAQRDAGQDEPRPEDIHRTGVFASILQLLRLPDGTVKVLAEGEARAEINYYTENEKFFEAEAKPAADDASGGEENGALMRSLLASFERYAKLNRKVPQELLDQLKQVELPAVMADAVAPHLAIKIAERQEILEEKRTARRLERLCELLEREISLMSTEKKIRTRIRDQIEKNQKEYYLNEQMKAIQNELGDDSREEIAELEKKIGSVKLSEEAREKAKNELKKLKLMSPMSAEATVIRNYLDWLLSIPWEQPTRLVRDLSFAEKVLDEDHYGLEKVKERIVEHLAVQTRTKSLKGQILCLAGPPGVGKTSLARSIARATGRNFVRLSLGGIHDESEIRGHRRTYIGSLPGKIIQSMKKAKSSNPLFLLDEIDKLGRDFRGDPASALLEVLDPEQNNTFNDHYLEVDYDLSNVMFITTANTLSMPRPLLDRMEVIRISGYTEDEKLHIARRHLIPKQIKNHGLRKGEWDITAEALRELIQRYTRESGVRNLEREIAKLNRKAVKRILSKGKEAKKHSVAVTKANLRKFAGIPRYEYNVADKDDHVGVTTGLAYTETGGDLLPIEAVLIPGGRGKITLTGKLGDVMQESAQAAWSYVRSRSYEFGIRIPHFHKHDIHIHVPEGAIPKDGPSAGAAMCTSIVSALTGIPVSRDIAMTGEISLRGMVMPIGGLKEKLLAALRGGMKTVLIPEKNRKDLEEIPANVKKGLKIVPVSTVGEVLKFALAAPLAPLSREEAQQDILPSVTDGAPASDALPEAPDLVTH